MRQTIDVAYAAMVDEILAETGGSTDTVIEAVRVFLEEETPAEREERERRARIEEGRRQAAFYKMPGMAQRQLPSRRTRAAE